MTGPMHWKDLSSRGPLPILRPQKIYQSLSNLPEKASREAATQRGMEELYQK